MPTVLRSRRAALVAAFAFGVLILGMSAGMVVLDSLTHAAGTGGPLIEALDVAAAAIPATTVSVLLAVRRPGNPIGWLLFAILFIGISPAAQYDVWVFRMDHGSQLLGRAAVALQEAWPLFLISIAVLVWVFADGKPSDSARTRRSGYSSPRRSARCLPAWAWPC